MAADGLDFIFIIWMITFYFFVVLCEVRKSVRRAAAHGVGENGKNGVSMYNA